MGWSEKTEKALANWLNSPKWHEGSPNDDPKFYDFVGGVWEDAQKLWDEAWAREKITAAAKERYPKHEPLVQDGVDRAMSLGTTILDFLDRMKEEGRVVR